MNKDRKLTPRSEAILQEMHGHIRRRLEKRLDKFGKRTDSQAKTEIKKAHEKYCLSSILKKGAACASGVSIATHVAKATHPDLQVKQVPNPNIKFRALPDRSEVGSHVLPDDESLADATGNGAVNSAAYELYLLLDIRFQGKKLGEWLHGQDQDALSAFAEGSGTEDAVDVYSVLLNEKNSKPSADARLKQLYWLTGSEPTDNASYHLLAPLYATALTHRFYAQVSPNTWFFGDHNKAARKALREQTAFESGYTNYPNLAVQKLGGTKPQNISQLNSERGGQNYLLASLPPSWESSEIYAPMRDVFRMFKGRPDVRRIVGELKHFLETDPVRNMHTRDLRDDLTTMLVDELMLFTFKIHSMAPGWTIDERCQLSLEEQYWLDPGRAREDVEFAEARRQSDWHEAVSARAANWLNRELNHKSPLSFGDAEHGHWKRRFESILTAFRRQLDDLQDALRDEDDDPEGEAA